MAASLTWSIGTYDRVNPCIVYLCDIHLRVVVSGATVPYDSGDVLINQANMSSALGPLDGPPGPYTTRHRDFNILLPVVASGATLTLTVRVETDVPHDPMLLNYHGTLGPPEM